MLQFPNIPNMTVGGMNGRMPLCVCYLTCDLTCDHTCNYVHLCSSDEGKKGVRWPGLSAPLPETRYGPDWLTKDLEMKVVEEGDDEVKWSGARISSDLPGR